MSKKVHNKPLRVETLENRQLLAAVVGNGVEVLSDFLHSNGRIYDQVLMTGASVTVTADPGQHVRVSFLDQNGDIVQTELTGAGTMTISLEALKRAGDTGYVNTNPDQKLAHGGYVQGLASITLDKPELSTNLVVYPVGKLVNPGLFSGAPGKGGDGLADIARITLVGNDKNVVGFSNMGNLHAGGVVFSADSGVVGIRGEAVALQGRLIISDIDSRGEGKPWLAFNANSQFQYVSVAGGNLRQTNDAAFETGTFGGVAFFNMTTGSTSDGVQIPKQTLDPRVIRNFPAFGGHSSDEPRAAFEPHDSFARTAARPAMESGAAFDSSSTLENDTLPGIESLRVVVI